MLKRIDTQGNANETKLFPDAFNKLKDIAKAVGMDIAGVVISLDGAYDSKKNRKMIFNAGMVPNINENKRNRKSKKRAIEMIRHCTATDWAKKTIRKKGLLFYF